MWMVCGAARAGDDRDWGGNDSGYGYGGHDGGNSGGNYGGGNGGNDNHGGGNGRNNGLSIVSVSTRPDMVAGGNVLVRVEGQGSAGARVFLNGHDVTSAFQAQADG